MGRWRRTASLLTGIAVVFATQLAAQGQTGQGSPPASTTEGTGAATLVFVPPTLGTPSSRVGAGTRGSQADDSLVALLLPPGGGLTTLEKPPLIWRLTADISGVVRAELLDLSPGGTGVARTVEGRFRAGFYTLDLARSDMVLHPGRVYRWSVSVIEAGSGRVLSSAAGHVERTGGDPVDQGDPMANARAAAAKGLWFDALAPLFRITLGGQARLAEADAFSALARSADLPASAYGSE